MTDTSDMPPPTDESAHGSSDVGRLVDGRYRLSEVIGTGGMATVHRAFDTKLERFVAVKLLRREATVDPDIAMRFRREALAATVLRHPNIIACLETGTDNGQPFLVMELIEGEDLAGRLRRVGRLAPGDAARIGLDVARALGVAHIRGIVHRDVKPGNIVLARDGRAMVTDFGIARLAADAEGAVPGTTLGSVHYFSPEQATGATTTPASDVYSLGLVLYESLTGQRAWSGDTTAALAAARIGNRAPSVQTVRPSVPAALDAVVVRALDPDPSERFDNGNAMAAALEPLVASVDPGTTTASFDSAPLAAAVGPSVAPAPAPAAPPLQPGSGPGTTVVAPSTSDSRNGRGSRRASPAIAGPLVVLLVVATIVVGGLFIAALPGPTGSGGLAAASATPRANRSPSPRPTARPTLTPTPVPTPVPAKATPKPQPTPKPAAGKVPDLCEPFFGLACGLDKGTYAPAAFTPRIQFKLGDGWAAAANGPDLVSLTRDSGVLTFAGSITSVFPRGEARPAPKTARALVETFIGTDGVAAGKPKNQKIGNRTGRVIDLTPTGRERVSLFGTTGQTFYLEPFGTTRITVVDAPDGILIIGIEPTADTTIEAILPTASAVIKTLRFR
ncbi:MAG: protein kinase domain-containing protein [Chloroflexota bacterium]